MPTSKKKASHTETGRAVHTTLRCFKVLAVLGMRGAEARSADGDEAPRLATHH